MSVFTVNHKKAAMTIGAIKNLIPRLCLIIYLCLRFFCLEMKAAHSSKLFECFIDISDSKSIQKRKKYLLLGESKKSIRLAGYGIKRT